jgi:hypothetical protein
MHKNVRLSWTIVITFFLLFIGSIGCSSAQEGELGVVLLEIDSQRASVETDIENLESEYLSLLEEYDSPEDKGGIYSAMAFSHAQSGMIQPEKTAEYCEKALQYPLDIAMMAQMYVFWADALQVKSIASTENEFLSARRNIAEVSLTGLKLILDRGIPRERQEPPAVGIYDVPPSDPEFQSLLEKHNEEVAIRKEVMLQNKLIQHRNALTEKITFLYSLKPDAIDELANLTTEILDNDSAIKELLVQVKR